VRVCTGTLKKFHGACLTQAGVRLPVEHLPDTSNDTCLFIAKSHSHCTSVQLQMYLHSKHLAQQSSHAIPSQAQSCHSIICLKPTYDCLGYRLTTPKLPVSLCSCTLLSLQSIIAEASQPGQHGLLFEDIIATECACMDSTALRSSRCVHTDYDLDTGLTVSSIHLSLFRL